jgi:aspartate aminotransferase
MPVSKRTQAGMASGSWVRKMFDEGNRLKLEHGSDKVFDLSLGNPIMEPPPEFKRELKRLANSDTPGMHRYMENAGYLATRDAVAKQISKETRVAFGANDIVMTCGAAGAINSVLKSILDPGDEIIVFAPYFAEYLGYIQNHDGHPVIVGTDHDFMPDLKAMEKAITSKTRGVLINFPNNPSGAVYSDKLLHEMGEILAKAKHPIYLISDEPYRKIVFDGIKCPFIWSHYKLSIVVTSYSKDLALPGERIGYIAIHPDCPDKSDLIAAFIHCNRTLGFVNAPAMMQNVIRGLQGVSVSIAKYQQARDFLYSELTGMGYKMRKPEGTFYMYPETPIKDDVSFVRELQKHLVLTVPGVGFGTPGYFRISYCVDDSTIEGSLDGLRKAIDAVKA